MGDACLSESPEEEDNDSPGPLRGDHSPKTPLPEPLSPSVDDWLGSPRKRTQTLPTFNCPLTGMAAKTEALNRWSRIQESTDEKSGTLSEDIFKILDLRTSGSFFGGSTMSNKEGEDRLTTRRGSENIVSSTSVPQTPESDFQSPRMLSNQKSVDTTPVSSPPPQINSMPELKKDPGLPLLDSLQQENKELKATVAELQSALEAERRRVAALEICLKNAERSRDEAQRRNGELQRDIQQFLLREKAPT